MVDEEVMVASGKREPDGGAGTERWGDVKETG